MQTWPLVTNAASTMRSASARSAATSGARMAASLPPSSSTTGRVVAAAAAMTACPVPTPPVNDTMSTPGWPTSAAPRAASGPFTTLSTPGGSTAAMAAATSSTVPGHVGGALTTTVSPASSAGSTLLAMTETGQLKGRMAATTPWGTHSIRVAPPLTSRAASASATSGAKAVGHAGHGGRVEDRLEVGLAVLAREQAGQVARLDGGHAGLGRRDDRRPHARPSSSAAHAGWDRRAASTARSSCAGLVAGAWRTTSAGRAGFVTG